MGFKIKANYFQKDLEISIFLYYIYHAFRQSACVVVHNNTCPYKQE